jgi:toxin ParE1/3/4
MNVLWTEQAQQDFARIYRQMEELSPRAGRDFAKLVVAARRRLADYPDSGRVVPEFEALRIREVIVGRYRLVYERFPDRIEVIALHPSAVPFGR